MTSPNGVPTGRLGRLLLDYGIETVQLAEDVGGDWLEKWQPDVISAHGAPSWVLDTADRLSIPYVDTLHMPTFMNDRPAEETTRGRRIWAIVAVGELLRRQYLDLNPTFPPERIITIPNGVDDTRRTLGDREQARSRWGISDEYVFVTLARHCLQKNTDGSSLHSVI